MRKILLIGKLDEIARSLNECLEDQFHVQLCSEELDMIRNMAKVTRPELFIVCQIGVDELDGAIFSWIKKEYPKSPVLVISTVDQWGKIQNYCNNRHFDHLFRPVTKQELIDKCSRMLEGKQAGKKEETSPQAVLEGKVPRRPIKKEKRQYRIMVVDDSPLVLRNTKLLLEGEYQVFVAPSGEKALDLIPKREPDLVLLDYEMPGMDGRAVYEAMLKDEYMATIPVIFLTYIANKDQVYGVLQSQPAGYILKPPDKDRLLEEIHKVLG